MDYRPITGLFARRGTIPGPGRLLYMKHVERETAAGGRTRASCFSVIKGTEIPTSTISIFNGRGTKRKLDTRSFASFPCKPICASRLNGQSKSSPGPPGEPGIRRALLLERALGNERAYDSSSQLKRWVQAKPPEAMIEGVSNAFCVKLCRRARRAGRTAGCRFGDQLDQRFFFFFQGQGCYEATCSFFELKDCRGANGGNCSSVPTATLDFNTKPGVVCRRVEMKDRPRIKIQDQRPDSLGYHTMARRSAIRWRRCSAGKTT